MAREERRLVVDAERCIGCRACCVACPADLITLSDADHRRTVRFAAMCGEACDRCVAVCPTAAIALQLAAGMTPGAASELGFELSPCPRCGAPVTTAKMLSHLRAAIPARLQSDAEGRAWLDLCPRCRREAEAERMARGVLLTRPG